MMFPACVQGGWPQLISTETSNLASQTYDIGKSYAPRFVSFGHYLLYTLGSEDSLKNVQKEFNCTTHEGSNRRTCQ